MYLRKNAQTFISVGVAVCGIFINNTAQAATLQGFVLNPYSTDDEETNIVGGYVWNTTNNDGIPNIWVFTDLNDPYSTLVNNDPSNNNPTLNLELGKGKHTFYFALAGVGEVGNISNLLGQFYFTNSTNLPSIVASSNPVDDPTKIPTAVFNLGYQGEYYDLDGIIRNNSLFGTHSNTLPNGFIETVELTEFGWTDIGMQSSGGIDLDGDGIVDIETPTFDFVDAFTPNPDLSGDYIGKFTLKVTRSSNNNVTVPEPSLVGGLFVFGLSALGIKLRRRKK